MRTKYLTLKHFISYLFFGILPGLLLILSLHQNVKASVPIKSSIDVPANQNSNDKTQEDTTRFLMWNPEIRVFDSLNVAEPDPKNAILFTGSSSIRLWSSIKEDMSPYPVIQRGYGGAKLDDYAYFAKRIIYPHQFRAMVFFIANDITNSPTDKTPNEMIGYIDRILQLIRVKYPDTPIFWIEITPTMNRWSVWNKTKEANSAIKAYCESHKDMTFIETSDAFLTRDGVPNNELFRDDHLHLNDEGYKIWTEIIKTKLNEVLGSGQ